MLLAAAAGLFLGPVAAAPHLTTSPAAVALAVALGFLLAEIAVVHYDFFRQAHSFSLSEIPLVLGLFFVTPEALVLAQIAGAGAALVLHRRQRGIKLVYNLATFALGSTLAVTVFSLVAPAASEGGGWGPWHWCAAILAAIISSSASSTAVFFAIALSEGAADWRRASEQMGLALLATTGSASLGMLGVLAASVHGAGLLLLAVPVATFLLAYRAYVIQRQERDSLEFLYDSARVLETGDDLNEALIRMLRNACATFRADVAQFVLVSHPDRSTALLVTWSGDAGGVLRLPLEQVAPLLRRGMRLPEPAMLTLNPPVPGPGGVAVRDGMLARLGQGDEPDGALLVANRLGVNSAFGAGQLRLFQTLVTQIDVSLENGRLARMAGEAVRSAEEERRNSLSLQRGLLPVALPHVPGVSYAVRYRPSAAGAEIGGDWYDVVALPARGDRNRTGRATGVVVGDVMGHDFRSAARMAQARSALRAYASEGHDAAGVMERLNALLATSDPGFMATCCYLEHDLEAGYVDMVLAGHPPPVLISADGIRLLEAEPGLPIGVDDAARYTCTAVPFPAGSTLVLFTDGLVESRDRPLSDGLERLAGLPAWRECDDVDGLADALLAAMVPDGPADDVALVVFRSNRV